MDCLVCGHQETKVIDSRNLHEGQTVRRRRACTSDLCGNRFTTYEKRSLQLPVVVKIDGKRENYAREKISKGLNKACSKRPITTAQISAVIDGLEHFICENFRDEVPSHHIGEIIMERLQILDPVSFVRFASFYCNFDDISGFIETIQKKNTISSQRKIFKKPYKGKSSEQVH